MTQLIKALELQCSVKIYMYTKVYAPMNLSPELNRSTKWQVTNTQHKV